MPDLDLVAFWCCESVLHDEKKIPSNSGGDDHYVTWEPAPPDHDYSMWWRCDCWPWKKNKTCKHTEQAKAEWCGWDTGPGIGDAGEPIEETRQLQNDAGEDLGEVLVGIWCPRCGRPATAQRWAV